MESVSVRTISGIVASGLPDDAAIGAPGRPDLARRELSESVGRIGRDLRQAGVGRDEVVASILPAGPEAAVLFLGVACAAVAAPLDPSLSVPELGRWLEDVRPVALLVPPAGFETAEAVASNLGVSVGRVTATGPQAGRVGIELPGGPRNKDSLSPDPDDVALILHTSGTTSRPKRVPLRHRNLVASAANVASTLDLGPEDRCLGVMPLFHIHGLVASVLASLWAGGSVSCPPRFAGTDVFGWIEHADPTWITAVPTMYQAMLDRIAGQRDLIANSRLRMLRSSSSSLPPSLHASLEADFGMPVVEAYGMSEAAHQIASNTPDSRIPGSVGRPTGLEVVVFDESHAPCGIDTEGEIAIRGNSVIDGYTDPETTAVAFVDGWFLTGDRGVMDSDGVLRLTGRSKEMINRAGETISPIEIDDVLLSHPDVAQALTFAVPDHRLGEQVAAMVVPVPHATLDDQALRRFIADQLAAAKVPRRVLVVADLPRGPTGKPRRIGLADELGLVDLDGPPVEHRNVVAPETPVEEIIHGMWVEVLDREDLGVEDRFLDVGGDSMLAMRLLARVADTLDLEPSVVDFFDRSTIRDQARLIEEMLLQ